jgi:hypothetical protein
MSTDLSTPARRAAQAVRTLINAQPTTPTEEQIATIIGAALAMPSAARETYLASDWCRALDDYLDARCRARSDKEHDALDARLRDVAKAICAEPVRTPDDLVIRAAIATHWLRCEITNPSHTEEHVLAAVVKGVLDMAGLRFDDAGRLL